MSNEVRFYRVYEYLVSAGVTEWDEPLGPARVQLAVSEYAVTKRTPKGVWLDCYGNRRFVLTSARKQFASPTREAAYVCFLARKKRQLKILTAQVRNVREAIALGEREQAAGIEDERK